MFPLYSLVNACFHNTAYLLMLPLHSLVSACFHNTPCLLIFPLHSLVSVRFHNTPCLLMFPLHSLVNACFHSTPCSEGYFRLSGEYLFPQRSLFSGVSSTFSGDCLFIQNEPSRSSVCRQRVLCRSLAGNPVYLLTITSNLPEDEGKRKRAIVLTSRVHPGETPASWIMKGAIDFLTSDNPRAEVIIELRGMHLPSIYSTRKNILLC